PEPERTQEDRSQKLALADAHVKQVLLVVFKLDPRAAIRNDLRDVQCAALEEDARRAMKLRNDHALGTVDDEGAVVSHQRDFAEEDFFFLDVADRQDFGVRIFVENSEPDLDLQRNAVAHAAFLALLLIVFVFQTDRLAAVFAKLRANKVERAATMTKRVARGQRVHLDRSAAVFTV